MNDVDFPVARVLEGIDAAARAGLAPVKVNMVVKRGVNDDGRRRRWRRFPRDAATSSASSSTWTSATTNGWRMDDVVPAAEIVAAGSTTPSRSSRCRRTIPGEVATRWRYADGQGEVGVIASVTQPFCGDCARARLSADGQLYTCLFATQRPRTCSARSAPARPTTTSARSSAPSGRARTDRYSELRARATPDLPRVEMSYIGG